MGILVVTTCGTIGAMPYPDPVNPPESITVPPDGRDLVAETLKTGPFSFAATRTITLEPKDSKDITGPYRDNILKIFMEAPEREILLTHGTDRILGSAGYFHQRFRDTPGLNNKVVILTGSMTPLANGPQSDGFMNLEFSLRELKRFAAITSEGERRAARGVFIVLCDFDDENKWRPRLYSYAPGKYEKVYTSDGRYNKLVPMTEAAE